MSNAIFKTPIVQSIKHEISETIDLEVRHYKINKQHSDAFREKINQLIGVIKHEILKGQVFSSADEDLQTLLWLYELGDKAEGRPHNNIALKMEGVTNVKLEASILFHMEQYVDCDIHKHTDIHEDTATLLTFVQYFRDNR